jgi:hypothetical protein
MAVRLSDSRSGCPLHPARFLVLISVSGWVDPRTIVWLEGLGQLKNPITSSEIEPATFRLVAWCPLTQSNVSGLWQVRRVVSASCGEFSGWKYGSVECFLTAWCRYRISRNVVNWSRSEQTKNGSFVVKSQAVYLHTATGSRSRAMHTPRRICHSSGNWHTMTRKLSYNSIFTRH